MTLAEGRRQKGYRHLRLPIMAVPTRASPPMPRPAGGFGPPAAPVRNAGASPEAEIAENGTRRW